jgi:Na+/melibiose symporter-like transporter
MTLTNVVWRRAGDQRRPFLWHVAEMTLAMMAGMVASAAVFLSIVNMNVAEALRQHALLFVVVQAFGMTLAMIGWMKMCGHVWRSCFEMGVAMIAPAIPLIALRASGLISGSVCGVYCVFTFAAMLLVMLHRRRDYDGAHALASPR